MLSSERAMQEIYAHAAGHDLTGSARRCVIVQWSALRPEGWWQR